MTLSSHPSFAETENLEKSLCLESSSQESLNSPEVRDEALIKGKELIEGAYTEKGCIHYLWTADLNHPGRVVVYEEWESGADLEAHLKGEWYLNMFGHLAQYNILNAETNKYRVDIKEPVYGEDGVATGYFTDESPN